MTKIIIPASLVMAIILDIIISALQQDNIIPNFSPVITGIGTFVVSLVFLLGVTQDL